MICHNTVSSELWHESPDGFGSICQPLINLGNFISKWIFRRFFIISYSYIQISRFIKRQERFVTDKFYRKQRIHKKMSSHTQVDGKTHLARATLSSRLALMLTPFFLDAFLWKIQLVQCLSHLIRRHEESVFHLVTIEYCIFDNMNVSFNSNDSWTIKRSFD